MLGVGRPTKMVLPRVGGDLKRARFSLRASAVLAGLSSSHASAQTLRFDYVRRMLPPDADTSWAAALGDLDGDGDLDAFVGNDGQQCRLYLNDGSGVFADATSQLPAFVGATRAVELGDADGDGDLDAYVGNTPQNRLYLNGGTGGFTDVTATNLPLLFTQTQAVAMGDLDGDGDLDAFVGNVGQNRLYRNGGGGTGAFTDVTATNLPAQLGNTTAVALGDVDGDGDLDVLLGSYTQNRLYLNNSGTGTFTDATFQLPAMVAATWAVALGDVDGDGDLDALIGNFESPGTPNRLFLNNGFGLFTDATPQLPVMFDDTQAVTFGDLDGDGDLDAFVGNFEQQNRLLVNNGSGVFVDATGQLPAHQDETLHVALGDVDGDGDLDALIGNNRQDRLYLNDGSGAFTDATAQLPANLDATRAVAIGDVDGDGDLDALIGNRVLQGQPNRLYLNNGVGVFSDAGSLLPSIATYTTAVALGDVDADGDLDALIGSSYEIPPITPQQMRLYLNNGAGLFSDATSQLPPILDLTEALALGDVDGDGDLDVLVGNANLYFLPGQPDRLYLNNGSGVFTNATSQLPPILDATLAVALGDLDGDGDLDVLLGNTAPCSAAPCPGAQNRLYLNNGSGIFLDATGQLPAILDVTSSLALGDYDGDGDLDALIGNWGQNRFLLNNGSAVFTDATSLLPPLTFETSQAFAAGDLDGDGDLDAFVGSWGQDRVLSNLTRHLARRGLPRIGKPLTLDLSGPAGGSWLLAFSLGTASIPIPALGTLRLSPASSFLHSGGVLDAQGRATVTFQVPAISSLLGIPVHWQAGVAPPARFTNLETTTATTL